MGLRGSQIVIVSDIGCSGLFDTFFHTHAMHGLHGRALTYAAGLKLARPELNVIVTMGDGGQGIGGAHLLAACRRNLDLTLLVLNNFNFGMTGGQFSATTPAEAQVGSGFLNQLEKPLDVCRLARAAGAPYVKRCSGHGKDLAEEIERAIGYQGFSVVDIWGICPGRYTKRNRLTPKAIEAALAALPSLDVIDSDSERKEFGAHYRELTALQPPVSQPPAFEKQCRAPEGGRREVIILGDAGQRVLTAGEILCLAGMTAGLTGTQKNEYNITVLRGPSVSEVITAPGEIGFTGIDKPDAILAVGQEGVERRKGLFERTDRHTQVIKSIDVTIPSIDGQVHTVDFKRLGINGPDRALASLALLAKMNRVLTIEMLQEALSARFSGAVLAASLDIVERVVSDAKL
jgi:2-oxoglutarate/2-oxoacid ferredoxin oxidoreductase subunit beta